MQKLVRNFGDDEGNEVNFNGTIVQALLMMNGKEINDEIGVGKKGGGGGSTDVVEEARREPAGDLRRAVPDDAQPAPDRRRRSPSWRMFASGRRRSTLGPSARRRRGRRDPKRPGGGAAAAPVRGLGSDVPSTRTCSGRCSTPTSSCSTIDIRPRLAGGAVPGPRLAGGLFFSATRPPGKPRLAARFGRPSAGGSGSSSTSAVAPPSGPLAPSPRSSRPPGTPDSGWCVQPPHAEVNSRRTA